MRFASLGGQSNYAQAGKAVADDAARIFDAARKNSVNYGDLANMAMRTKSAQNIAQTKADAQVKEAEIKADAKIKVTKEDIKQDNIVRGSRRKAGVVAALGKAGAGIADVFMGKPEKRDTSSLDALIEKNKTAADKYRQQADGISTDFKPVSTSSDSSSTSGEPAGKTPPSSSSTTGTGGAISSFEKTGKKGKYTAADMTQFAIQAGFSPENARIMGAIGMGESGGSASIDTVASGLDPQKKGEYSIGLFQINAQAHGDKLAKLGYTEDDLRDPLKNAKVAKLVYDEVGSFKPWSVYKSGAYQQHL